MHKYSFKQFSQKNNLNLFDQPEIKECGYTSVKEHYLKTDMVTVHEYVYSA